MCQSGLRLTAGPQDSVSHFISCSFLSMASKSIENTATPSLSSRRFSSCDQNGMHDSKNARAVSYRRKKTKQTPEKEHERRRSDL